MKLKIRSILFAQHPMWKVLKEDGEKYDLWDRFSDITGHGVTKEELIDILQRRGHEVVK